MTATKKNKTKIERDIKNYDYKENKKSISTQQRTIKRYIYIYFTYDTGLTTVVVISRSVQKRVRVDICVRVSGFCHSYSYIVVLMRL